MTDLLSEMHQCKSLKACIALALTDAYGSEEAATAWLSCLETLLEHHKQVKLMGQDVTLIGLDLNGTGVVAVCKHGKHKTRVTLDSIEFPKLTVVEKRWLQAWRQYEQQTG